MAKKENNEDGVWRTINGRRVFIKNGQSLQDAMKESGKFNNTKTEVKKDNNKVEEETEKELDEEYDKAHKKDEEETEEELDKKYDEAHQKNAIFEDLQDFAKIPDYVLEKYSGDELYDNYLSKAKEDKFYAIKGDKIIAYDTTASGSDKYWVEEFPLDDVKSAKDWLKGDLEYSDYLEDKASSKKETDTSEVPTDARSQITSDDLDNDVNFKITGKDGSTNYINAFWSWNDIDEEDVPEGEDPEDWRAIAYNILDENGEEIDGGMMITDQENFNAEDLCKDLAEMSGYSRDMEVSRIDDGDYEEAIENDKSSNEESDLDKVKRIQNDLSKKDNLTQAEKDWQSQLNDTQKKLENGKSREDIIKELDEETSDPYDDPESEESQRLQSIQSRYDDYLQKTEGRGASYGEIAHIESLRGKELDDFEKELDDFEAEEESKSDKSSNNEGTPNYDKYSADEQDILDRYGQDYGYESEDKLKNLKGQIDYMRNPNESIRQTAERLVEGGDFLIYNGDVEDYLKERNIKYNDDNFFDKYKQDMAEKIEKLYNDASNQTMNNAIREKASKSNNIDLGIDKEKQKQRQKEIDEWESKQQRNENATYEQYEKDVDKADNFMRDMLSRNKNNKSTNEKNYREIEKQLLDDYTKVDTEDLVDYYNTFKEQGKEKFAGRLKKEIDRRNGSTNETMNNAIREKANKNNQETANGLKLLKARKNEAGTETEDLINQYNQYAKEGKGSPDTYKSLKKQIAENRKASKSTNDVMNEAIREKASKKSKTQSNFSDREIKNIKTQKSLKSLIDEGKAKDITTLDDKKTKALRDKHGRLDVVQVTKGLYGMNGALLQSSKTGEYFVITSRNGNLFYWV